MAGPYYVGNAGNDSPNDGLSPAELFLTMDKVNTLLAAGETVIVIGDSFSDDTNRLQLQVGARMEPQTFQGTTLTRAGSYTDYILEFDDLIANDTFAVLDGFIIDGENVCTGGIDARRNCDAEITVQNCSFFDIKGPVFKGGNRGGRLEFLNNKIRTSLATDNDSTLGLAYFGAGTALGEDDPQEIVFARNDIDSICTSTITRDQIYATIKSDTTDATSVDFNDNKIKITYSSSPTGSASVVEFVGSAATRVVGNDINLDVNTSPGSGSMDGIVVAGLDATRHANGSIIARNKVITNAQGGYGILVGITSTTDVHCDNGIVSGNYVKGVDTAGKSPHGIAVGKNFTGDITGNVVESSYAGYLFSEALAAEVTGNLAVNCSGPSFYAKGHLGAAGTLNIRGNVAVVDRGTNQRDMGILAINAQSGNTVSTDFIENIVIFDQADPGAYFLANGGYLASVATSQLLPNFERNVYYLPDTTDLTDDLFNFQGTKNTIVEWNANSEVTGDQIVLLPRAKIAEMVNYYKQQAAAASGVTGGGGGSLGLGL
tara:strand:+ start:6500 stop:8131 length:1632 start_codon:yes stop_codon:yes gene_type:complete